MKFEGGLERESLDASIMNIARAYGFSLPPVMVSKKAITDQGDIDLGTALTNAVVKGQQPSKKPLHVWGATKKGGGTTLSFTILSSRHAISHALVIKSALSIAELAGYTDLVVGVSSIGDTESRRRFQRELGTFFRKYAHLVPPEILKRSATKPETAYRELLTEGGELAEKLPRPIDYLSENSRKSMVDTLHMFESVGIHYELQAHLPASEGVHAELLFAISAIDSRGERVIVATGGRIDDLMRKNEKSPTGHSVSLSVSVPETLEFSREEAKLSCFVVHVGEAAKLKSFSLLDALWRANVSVQEALLSESLRDQMEAAKLSQAKYIAIVGQREALDNTVIVRNLESGMQQSYPLDKLAMAVSRGR
jgi:histidyl-tRNA synthetase